MAELTMRFKRVFLSLPSGRGAYEELGRLQDINDSSVDLRSDSSDPRRSELHESSGLFAAADLVACRTGPWDSGTVTFFCW